jgi:CubicO group peptidase (beta-lactamase class C family)
VTTTFATARQVIADGLAARAYPAAVVELGRQTGPLWQEAFGRLRYDPDAPACRADTIFDLASLTKVIATTSLSMRQVDRGALALDRPVAALLADWRGGSREGITIRHLLDHSSGLPAHVRFWEASRGRAAIQAAIASLPLERAPGVQSVYSDPGFILLGFLLEDVGGAPLDAQFESLLDTAGGAFAPGPNGRTLGYLPDASLRDRIAPTEDDPWRQRVLRGEVHDENAAALDGVAGHAGLFGTAADVGAFARLVLTTFREPTALGSVALMKRFASRTGVPGSSRALGWDTMLPTSSCGTRLSPTAIGHTGFTGTSLWIDRERDLYVVFLTNRVHPTRANDALAALRPKLHDAVAADLEF